MGLALSLAGLLVQQTKESIYAAGLAICQRIGLPVTSWAPGDPTRSLFYLQSEILETWEKVVVGFISTIDLDLLAIPNDDGSPNPWLKIVAKQVYNVDVPDATYATTTVNLTNTGGGYYQEGPGDLSFKNSTTGATYHSTSAITLTGVGTPGAKGSVTVVADVAGSAGSSGAGEIDAMVTGLLGVTCSNPTAAVGLDAQDPQTTVAQCRAKLGSLSPNGPATAYSYVARNSDLTGAQTVTRARTYPDSDTGNVLIVVASPSGTVPASDISLVQTAIYTWATPLCITPTIQSATPVTIDVKYSIWIYRTVNATSDSIAANIQNTLVKFFSKRPIGGDSIPSLASGYLFQSMIASEIGAVYPNDIFKVQVDSPSADVALTTTQVPILGVVTPTINIVTNPP